MRGIVSPRARRRDEVRAASLRGMCPTLELPPNKKKTRSEGEGEEGRGGERGLGVWIGLGKAAGEGRTERAAFGCSRELRAIHIERYATK